MASLTMMASFIGGVGAASINRHRSLVVPKAARAEAQVAKPVSGGADNQEKSNGRRAVVLAAAAVAAFSAAGQGMVAVAGGNDPKPGSPEAKKKYVAVCVTMPTATICHK